LPILCAVPFTGGLPHIVREEMMAIDAKSKLAANLLRFLGVFILFFFPVLFVFTTHSRKFGTKFPKNLGAWIF
jgi:hypothetical protein